MLDENEDGSILDEAKDGNMLNSISYPFFENLLHQVFKFFDTNKDSAISLEEDISAWFYIRDRDDDGKISLSEVLGTSCQLLFTTSIPMLKKINKSIFSYILITSVGQRH